MKEYQTPSSASLLGADMLSLSTEFRPEETNYSHKNSRPHRVQPVMHSLSQAKCTFQPNYKLLQLFV